MQGRVVELRPFEASVPILRGTPKGPSQLLGTGFFVGTDSSLHLVTARHVFEKNPLGQEETYVFVLAGKEALTIMQIGRIVPCRDYDLAVCPVTKADLPEAVPLPISKIEPPLNADVLCFEFSGLRIERESDKLKVELAPRSHKGNIVMAFVSTFPEKITTPSYLVSFPALQGASGAAVVTWMDNFPAAVGMLVENVEQQTLPAQTVQIQDGDSYRDETKYFLPYGKAIQGLVISRCLQEMGIPFMSAG
jgi:hypothetical protein